MKNYDKFIREIHDIQRWFHTTIYSYKVATKDLTERLSANNNVEQDVADAFNDVGYNSFSLIHRLSTDNIKMCKELALIRSISALEVYLIDSIREIYFTNKSPFMKKGVIEYQLGEILSCTDINELHEKYIEKQCRQLHSNGFEEVIKFYKNRFDIDFTKFNTTVNSKTYGLLQIKQFHQKRHLIVHRLGKTDEQYRKAYNTSDTEIKLDENDLTVLFKLLLQFAYFVNNKAEAHVTTEAPKNRVAIKIEILDNSICQIFDPTYTIPIKKDTSLPLSLLLEKMEYESENVFTIKLHGAFPYLRKYYKLLKKIASSGKMKILSFETISLVSNKKSVKQYAWADVEKVIELLPEKPWTKNIHKEIAQKLGWSNTKVFEIINNIVNEQPNTLRLSPKTKTLNIGDSFEITVNSQGIPPEKIDWKTDNDRVATVNCGKIYAISPGFAQISARIPGTTNYDMCTIVVGEARTPLLS